MRSLNTEKQATDRPGKDTDCGLGIKRGLRMKQGLCNRSINRGQGEMLFSKYYPELVMGLKRWSYLRKQKYGGHGVIRSNKDVLLYE